MSIKAFIDKLGKLGFDFNSSSTRVGAGTNITDLTLILLDLNGEASSIAIAEQIFTLYHATDPAAKLGFFNFLLKELEANADKVNDAIENYQAQTSAESLLQLNMSSESRRVALFSALNMAKNGTASLIKMREDLLKMLKENPELKPLDTELLSLFRSWFNRGFLEMHNIDWHTPAEVLEKLIEYEAVHEIQGWPDLRRRLAADRRCFAFFHPVMPNTPLIFVEVALSKKISDNIKDLLNQEPPDQEQEELKTAVFYSISNCFAGLKGVSFGNLLIKQVVESLSAEMPEITTFCTLSPVPGFMRWLHSTSAELEFINSSEQEALASFLEDNSMEKTPAKLLVKLCAWYLYNAKSRGKPKDPVARFHLGNGACLERINWAADLSANGLAQSAGIMVNYLYDRATLTRNHEAYEQQDKVICSNSVIKLLP